MSAPRRGAEGVQRARPLGAARCLPARTGCDQEVSRLGWQEEERKDYFLIPFEAGSWAQGTRKRL